MKKKGCFVVGLFCSMAVFSQANYEAFDYNAGNIFEVSNGKWVKNSGNEDLQIEVINTPDGSSNSLSYENIKTAGNRVLLKKLQGNVNAITTLPTSINTTVYVSFLLKVTDVTNARANNFANINYNICLTNKVQNESLNTGVVTRFGLKQGTQPDTFNLGVLNTTGGTISPQEIYGNNPQNYNLNQTYFIVLKYDMTGTQGVSSFWVNPLSTDQNTPTHQSNAGTSTKLSEVKSFVLRQTNNSMPNMEIDEIRISNSWEDVVSTPLSSKEINAYKKQQMIANTLVDSHLKLITENKTEIEIYSISGQLVHKNTYNANDLINVSTLKSGMYLVKINDGKKQTITKIIKK